MLNSNGTDSKLIKLLLRDARLWGVLSKLLEGQNTALKALQESYENENWTVLHEEDKDQLKGKIKDFIRERHSLKKKDELIDNLAKTSQNLIQLVNPSILGPRISANLVIGV